MIMSESGESNMKVLAVVKMCSLVLIVRFAIVQGNVTNRLCWVTVKFTLSEVRPSMVTHTRKPSAHIQTQQ